MPVSRAFFYLPLRVSSYRAIYIYKVSFKVPSKGAPPPCSPTGPLWTEMPVSTAFLYISLEDPGGEALQITTLLSKEHPPTSRFPQ
jgi:hypothetical protein